MSEEIALDPAVLLRRVAEDRSGLGAVEIGQIVAELESVNSTFNRYTLVSILGYGGMAEARPVVERLLTCSSDPQLAGKALDVLCTDWSLTAEYSDAVGVFARGVVWDGDSDVQLVALSIVGQELAEKADADWFRLLLSIAHDEAQLFRAREGAIQALAIGLGDYVRDLPSAAVDQPLDSEWSITTLRRAEEKIRLMG